MFVELGAIGAINFGYKRWVNRDIYYMKNEIKTIINENKLEYTIIETRRSLPWGYSVIISLNGKGFDKLKEIKELIETKIGYTTFIEQNKNLKTATIKIVINSVDENTKFSSVKTKPYEIYCGLNFTLNELIVDLRKFPHAIISGQTGCGKTELIRIMLTNLINNYTDRDINLYFSDLSDMCDFSIFENCKQTKGYAKNIEDSLKLFKYLSHIYTKRLEIFAKNGCKNIQEYNEKFYRKRMAYTYIVMDEMADYFPASQLENDYKAKVECYNYLRHFARKMRKVGMFLIIGIQRPDTTVLDPNLRSCLCAKVGFSQNSDASSKTVCDTTVLTNIENRKALLMYGNCQEWLKTLFIDDKIIEKYIQKSIVEDREKYSDYNKFLNKKGNDKQPKKENEKKKNSKVKSITDVIDSENNENVIPYRIRIENDK